MIRAFANKELENFFLNDKVPRGVGWANVSKIVRRKLFALDAAHKLSDLKAPPGNQLEALKDDLLGYHSIRVNDQWRVIFKWSQPDQGPLEVDVVDYH
ncbi:MAG: plasmid maintenance system killer protein [Nitrosomonas sp.]|nr:MAG: plasmid maintenance system killer protein [Nitrosomonas sp.]